MKERILIVFIVLIITLASIYAIQFRQTVPEATITTATTLCFIRNTEDGGSADMVVNISGGTVRGTFDWLPAERDSKTGYFDGKVKSIDDNEQVLDLWWNAKGEGTTTVEELKVKLTLGTATPGFGEMKDRGDGVYVYASPENIVYEPSLSLVDCNDIPKPVNTVTTTPERMTISGTYVCLPHKNAEGPQTLECALGLHADSGEFYSLDFKLSSQSFPNFATGDRITVTGVVTPVEMLSSTGWQKYPIVGIISVTDSAKKL